MTLILFAQLTSWASLALLVAAGASWSVQSRSPVRITVSKGDVRPWEPNAASTLLLLLSVSIGGMAALLATVNLVMGY